ncbi:hypothetical protein GpartN1_g6436.t1 [Galdieria partita]|uniref:RRM domain-containing protein n=1 Tax=Galdieria partita TaxID=83374 RepID=A0A9C7Q244_9RHOD|nr:hypothetical protein GpartN1_g6436.t1 [Galdieria partita]
MMEEDRAEPYRGIVQSYKTCANLIDKRCLFINNLDRVTTEEELTSYFQSFGPVKRCLVVNDAVTGQCRGYGFVKFQRVEDAAKVLDLGQRLVFCGQRILVDYALRRTKTEKSDQQGEETPWVAPKSSKLLGLGKGKSLKRLLDSSYASNSQDIMKRTILIQPIVQVPWIEQLYELLNTLKGFCMCIGPIRGILHCIFSTWEIAKEHISYLQQSCQKWQANIDVAFAHVPITKRCTVVVRNLPFVTSEMELMNTFSKSGPVKVVRLPKNPQHPNLCVGYGFVEYFLPKDAENAINNLNGIEWKGRTIAIDYALSKDKYLQEKQSTAVIESNPKETSQEVDKDVNIIESSSLAYSDRKDDSDRRTVWIRNLPLGVDEFQVESCFEAFGKIEKCWIEKDKNTGQSNGLAYVRFTRQHSVVMCLKKANELSEEWEDPILQKKLRNSVLAKEVSSGGIRLDGRRLIVSHASKDNSQQNKEMKDAEARNLHLLEEGFIEPKSKLAKNYPETELQKRLALYEWKKQKVERNPNIVVSSTRLCVHQLPRAMTEKELRKLIQIVAKEEIANNHMNLSSRKLLKNAFILRDSNRKLKDGSFRSTCRGFVQFTDPLIAEKCLQRLNRDSDILGTFHDEWKGRRLIVEFALQDKRKLLALEKKKKKNKEEELQMKKKETSHLSLLKDSKQNSTIQTTHSKQKSLHRRKKMKLLK